MYPDTGPIVAVDVECTSRLHPVDQAAARPVCRQRRHGYARASVADPMAVSRAVTALRAAGVDSERISVERAQTDAARPLLAETLHALSSGDHLMVPSLASLARSPGEFERIVEKLRVRGVELWVGGHRYDDLGQIELDQLRRTMTADLRAEATTEAEAEAEQRKRQAEFGSGPRGARPKLTAAEKLQLREEYDAGGRLEELEAKWGVSRATVFRALGPSIVQRDAN